MTSITAIGSYIPLARESNFERMSKFGIDEDFIRNKLGVETVSRKAVTEETSDMCVEAFKDLESRLASKMEGVDCLVVCTQNPDGGGLPHTSAVVHGKLDLPKECACFDISLGCSGYVYGLSIVKAFMQANGFSRGLFFTADPYSKILDPEDKNTILLFGDAATVTLLEPSVNPSAWQFRNFHFGTIGKDGSALENKDGMLVMNGRAVFNFSATEVPPQVRCLVERAGINLGDVDLFLFHQGSKFIVDQLIKRLDLPPEKVPIQLSGQGNTVSSSIPLLLRDRLNDQGLRRIVLSGFGVGLSWASCLLVRAN